MTKLSTKDEWSVKRKGFAKIHTHPLLKRAVVENFLGISFNGKMFNTVSEAKAWAVTNGESAE
jgi:hypothetical protein